MDILMLIVITIVALSMLLGKPIKIIVTHETKIPQPVLSDNKDPDEVAKEMKENALNIMEKFNKEWSGLADDGEK